MLLQLRWYAFWFILPIFFGITFQDDNILEANVLPKMDNLSKSSYTKSLPYYFRKYGVRGKNYDYDEEKHMGYILCQNYARSTCNETNQADCANPMKCYLNYRTDRMGCMAVVNYDTVDGKVVLGKADVQGCWNQNEAEVEQCASETECNVNNRLNASVSTGFVFCCCRTHMCNLNMTNVYVPPKIKNDTSSPFSIFAEFSNTFILAFLIIITVSVGIVVCVVVLKYRAVLANDASGEESRKKYRRLNYNVNCMVCVEGVVCDLRRVTLLEIVSRGRFGVVYRGVINDENVALKLFVEDEVGLWINEEEIYSSFELQSNVNICEFISTFEFANRHWLAMRYYSFGSLFDYLRLVDSVSVNDSAKIIFGFLNGLSFLHDQITATKRAPVVHRDLKSKNVLIRDDLTACITDFGLAVPIEFGEYLIHMDYQVGTYRYMAPEELLGNTDFMLNGLKHVDVYAASLILWEVLDRTNVYGFDEDSDLGPPMLPFENETGQNCSIEKMVELVVRNNRRPAVKPVLRTNKITSTLVDAMMRMWDVDTDARISASNARECSMHYCSYVPPKESAKQGANELKVISMSTEREHATELPTVKAFKPVLNASGPNELLSVLDAEDAHDAELAASHIIRAPVIAINNDANDAANFLIRHI